jgi:hypothetical protein
MTPEPQIQISEPVTRALNVKTLFVFVRGFVDRF